MNQDFNVKKKQYLSEKKKNSCRAVNLKKKLPAQAVSEKKLGRLFLDYNILLCLQVSRRG